MMKPSLLRYGGLLLLLMNQQCANRNYSSTCFKGRLEVKGICGNYTIKVIEGNLDPSKLETSWKDDVTGKTYTNVFALGSVCSFPDTVKTGDVFYFTLNEEKQECAVCMAYYPKPKKSLAIKVLDKACH